MRIVLWIAAALGALAGGIIQTMTGFGAAVVLMVVLSWFLDMTVAPSLTAAICSALSITVAWHYRAEIQWRRVLWQGILYAAVGIAVIGALRAFAVETLTIVFGALLIGLSVLFLFFADKLRIRPCLPRRIGYCAFSGLCAGLFAAGGPILALYYLSEFDRKESYIANLQIVLVFSNLANLTARIGNGYFPAEMIPLAAVGVVFVWLGQVVGERIGRKMSVERLRTAVYIAVGLSGVVTLVMQLV